MRKCSVLFARSVTAILVPTSQQMPLLATAAPLNQAVSLHVAKCQCPYCQFYIKKTVVVEEDKEEEVALYKKKKQPVHNGGAKFGTALRVSELVHHTVSLLRSRMLTEVGDWGTQHSCWFVVSV